MISHRIAEHKRFWLAWMVLSAAMVATAAAAFYVKRDVESDAKRQFDFACGEIHLRIDARIDAHAQILRSAAALFDASEEVSREGWHAFTSRQKVEQHLPGIQGIGFSLTIPRDRLTEHTQEIRSQGFPDYTVMPPGERELYSSIVYLEPFTGRNLRAFGYDMLSEPVRRSAMERARDYDVAAISGKVVLVQETDQDVQSGTLMYVPVYRKGKATDTVAQRRDALYGWVYSPYRMNDLMQGMLRGSDLEAGKRIRLQIFDSEAFSPDSLLYDSQPQGVASMPKAMRLILRTANPTSFNDHLWHLQFTQTNLRLNYGPVYGVISGGAVISLLLLGLIEALLNTRFKAEQLAQRLTVELRESEEKYRTVAIFTYDWEYWQAPDGSLLYVSPACHRLTGYRAEEFQQDPELMDRIVHPDDREEVAGHRHNRWNTAAEEDRHEVDFRIHTCGGEERWIAHVCQRVHGRDGQYLGRRASNRDITERKRIEAEKDKLEAQNRLLKKSQSLGRMAGAIAHHFNNQLQVMMMNLDFALRSKSSGEFPTENLTGAMQSARKAAEMSSLMLTYLGQTNCKREAMDLSAACLRSLPMLQASTPTNVLFESELPTPGPAAMVNANQIQQLLINLITNAWEASLGGRGAIRLTLKTVAAGDIPTANRFPIDCLPRDNNYACLGVADEGCGIADKDIETLFDPFYSTKFTGRGLGLPVVLGIVRAHQGAITVQSEPGRGSVFRVFLPITADAVPWKMVQAVQVPKMTESGTVLVIEDDAKLRAVLATAIKRMGFKVQNAQDGVEALEIFRQHQDEIRLVVCDLTMPRMDGWQTLSALRQIVSGIPVILCSGYSQAQMMDGDHPDLPEAFLSKPYSIDDLQTTIFQILKINAHESKYSQIKLN
jgi:PAS domain S-box-containing protein